MNVDYRASVCDTPGGGRAGSDGGPDGSGSQTDVSVEMTLTAERRTEKSDTTGPHQDPLVKGQNRWSVNGQRFDLSHSS